MHGQHWHLYLIMDIYSRKIVAWEIHETECGELAKKLIDRGLLRARYWQNSPVLHSDNGAPMTSLTLRARLAELGVLMFHSRLRVSNNNLYSESLFKTLKYCPKSPVKGFASLTAVCKWMLLFEQAYNEEHLHSGINFVTLAQRHQGVNAEMLAKREAVYGRAKSLNPSRWYGGTRNWKVTGAVSSTLENCRKWSAINRLLKRSYLDTWLQITLTPPTCTMLDSMPR
jgi:putative transposase